MAQPPVIEPNFEGEEMKIPEGMTEAETPTIDTKTAINTTVIILLVLVLAAIFAGLGYWYYLVMNVPLTDTTTEDPMIMDIEMNNTDINTETEMSNSDEIDAIETDIDNTNLEELDQEMAEIDAELEAEMGTE